MESSDPADIILAINSNSNKEDVVEVIDVNGGEPEQHTAKDSKHASPVNERAEIDDDDQESVIIEEVENKTIELNEDSDEEVDLDLVSKSRDSSNPINEPHTKATEFVVVNAANLRVAHVDVEAEPKNRYPIEDIHIKDELAESVTADLNANDVLENDPMDLLELNTRSESASSMRSQEETDYADDVSSIGSSSVQTGSSSSATATEWIKEYPWMLYEEGEEACGYCLYCDVKLNTKSQRSVKQHGASLYHKERCENYIAFREEEEKNGLGMKLIEIKEEFGTDSRVEALKLKRKSQAGALNNFNWRRWLEDYPWLERNSTEGTMGLCKYCNILLNIEFSYLRDRHQESVKHKEAEKQYEESNNKAEEPIEKPSVNVEKDKDSSLDNSQSKNLRWLEVLKNEPAMVRCKLCGHKLFKNNFLRHLRTNLHEQNEKNYIESEKGTEDYSKNKQNWKVFSKSHPWMVSDPHDEAFAYCKYCEKRMIYGTSAAKRVLHENSTQHKQNENEFKKRSRKVNAEKKSNDNDTEDEHEQDGIEEQGENKDAEEEEADDSNKDDNEENEEDDDDDEDNEVENENNKDDDEAEEDEEEENDEDAVQQEKESEDDNDSKKRIYKKLSDEWINLYPWCKKYRKDPTNFIFCVYCRIPLSVSYSRTKHQATSLHISAEKKLLIQQNKKQKLLERKQGNENSPFYEWAVPLKNNPSSYSCRYCRVRISKHYSKQQHASSKIHQINENIYKNNRRKSLRSDENNSSTNIVQLPSKVDLEPSNVAPTKKLQSFPKVVIKAPSTVTLIKQLQKKFPWLTYKRNELRSHYGYCKICDSSLYIRSMKHVMRHLRSARHMRILKAKKKEKVEKKDDDDEEKSEKIINKTSKEELQTSPHPTDNLSENQAKPPIALISTTEATSRNLMESHKGFNYRSTIAELKKRYSWIEKSSETPNYAFCRFCDTNIPLKILALRNHSISSKHRHCVINYYSADGKKFNREARGSNNADFDENDSKCGDTDNDVILLEENNEEILISEQDENWTVKSETMDEHEELDFLLQRSFNNTSNTQRNVRKSINADEPPTKRMKRSQSFRRLNDSNSSLLASLLTTPLTLASCLGPLIQQQIQHQANLSQVSQTKSTVTAPPTPEVPKISSVAVVDTENTYDLFFKSISETMKKLPVDLAAEGKLRVMQIICDLELQGLKRQESQRRDSVSSNTTSGGLNNQAASTSGITQPVFNSSATTNDLIAEQNGTGNENLITKLNVNKDITPPSKVTSANNVENPATSSAPSPIIGVMDKNGLQTLQFKTSVAKQIPKNNTTPTTATITSVANSGIRCIPFKNLSQPATPDSSNTKLTRIQVPMNAPTQNPNPNTNAINTPKNLINFRNIQITKRIGTPPTSGTPPSAPQQTVQKTSTMTNKSPQRTYITNIQPQLQRWGCSVNGSTSHQTPISSATNHLHQLSSQQTSTPISKK